ncbi:MAG TPA: hypothetical protein VF753_13380 [Terriglobales bacterium]
MSSVADHQQAVEKLFEQYTFTDTTTIFTLDKKDQIRSQHTDTFYLTPTPYEIFVLHVAHDGKPVSASNLQKQQKEIEHKMAENEKKAQKTAEDHPKNQILFSDIIRKSRFTPLRWDEFQGNRAIVYAFEPRTQVEHHGGLNQRIAGDMRGKMWVDPENQEVMRIEFTSVSALGMGLLGNVRGFEGYVEQQKVGGEIWVPVHQEFVAQGRQLVSGFRVRQVDEYSHYLKATTDVFQQIHEPKTDAGGATAQQ